MSLEVDVMQFVEAINVTKSHPYQRKLSIFMSCLIVVSNRITAHLKLKIGVVDNLQKYEFISKAQ